MSFSTTFPNRDHVSNREIFLWINEKRVIFCTSIDARKICRVLIDLTADGLKAVLSTREDEQIYEKIKSKYHRTKYEQSLAAQKRVSREVQEDDEDFELMQKNQGKRAKMFVDGDGLLIGSVEIVDRKKKSK